MPIFCEQSQTGKSSHDTIERWGVGCGRLREFLRGLRSIGQMVGQLQLRSHANQAGDLVCPSHLDQLCLR